MVLENGSLQRGPEIFLPAPLVQYRKICMFSTTKKHFDLQISTNKNVLIM